MNDGSLSRQSPLALLAEHEARSSPVAILPLASVKQVEMKKKERKSTLLHGSDVEGCWGRWSSGC